MRLPCSRGDACVAPTSGAPLADDRSFGLTLSPNALMLHARSAARSKTLPRLWMSWLTRCCATIVGRQLPLVACGLSCACGRSNDVRTIATAMSNRVQVMRFGNFEALPDSNGKPCLFVTEVHRGDGHHRRRHERGAHEPSPVDE